MAKNKHYEKLALSLGNHVRYKLDLIECGRREEEAHVVRMVPTHFVLRMWTFYKDNDLGHDKVKLKNIRIPLDQVPHVSGIMMDAYRSVQEQPELTVLNEIETPQAA